MSQLCYSERWSVIKQQAHYLLYVFIETDYVNSFRVQCFIFGSVILYTDNTISNSRGAIYSEGQRELVEQLHRQLSVKEAEARESGDEVAALHMRIKDLEKRLVYVKGRDYGGRK